MDEAPPPPAGGFDLRAARRATLAPSAITFPIAIALWAGTYYLMPPLSGMEDMLARSSLH